jgi:hypothetical protein
VNGKIRVVASPTAGFFGYTATTGGSHLFSLTRQDSPINASLGISSYGGIGFAGGKTSAPETTNWQMFITSAGNVGIGTTTPGTKLEVAGAITSSDSSGSFGYLHGAYNGGNPFYTINRAGGADSIALYADNTIRFSTNNSEKVRILSNGNVGIGTTTAGNPLTLSSAGAAGMSTSLGLYNTYNTAANRNWAMGLNVYGYGDFAIMQSAAQDVAPSVTRFMINNNGNVGIGTTNPGSKLDVAGNINATGVIGATLWSSADIRKLNVGQSLAFRKSDGTAEMIIDGNGNVGIGTTAPGEKLTLVDAGNANPYNGTFGVYAQNLTQGVAIGYSGISKVGSNVNSSMTLDAKGTGHIFMQTISSGNVGIGTTTPGTKLDVAGAIRTNNQLISTVAVGTAPLAVTSTTVNTNLNADLLDGYHYNTLPYQTALTNPVTGTGTANYLSKFTAGSTL